MSASHDILRSIGKDVYVAVSIKYIGSWYIYILHVPKIKFAPLKFAYTVYYAHEM